MGGTFGCIGEPLHPMPAQDFLPKLQHVLPLNLEIECFVADHIQDSSAATAADWLSLGLQIQTLNNQGFEHIVVIHGTDTLSYAAAVLSHFLGQTACVILTGSQYPLLTVDGHDTRHFSDAIDNLNLAFNTILNLQYGVYLAFHQHIVHGRSALKQHSTELDAFAGIPISEIQPPSSTYRICITDIERSKNFNCLSLMMQPIALPQQCQNLTALLNSLPDCLILQGFGTANLAVDDTMLEILKELHSRGCALILTTQVPFGAIDQHYAVNSWLTKAPVLLSNCLGHADLYAKALKMYLQYDSVTQWYDHWQNE